MTAVAPRPQQLTLGSGAAVDGFHPAVGEWFHRRFPEGPTPPQRDGWPHIAAATDTLIAAPTGSGKTLAGFLVCIDRLYRAHDAGEPITGIARVVYVSPLKALAVDIAENLQRPLAEIAEIARELGLDAPDIRVAVRTGDTTSSQRASMVRKPPSFVVTTPESLYLLVTSASGREALRTVDTVIVDEIHAVARDKRGSHLALTLERLEALCDARPTRIGLSATQRPIETVARLLVGDRPLPRIVDSGHVRELDLAVELPEGELEAVTSAEQMADVLDRIAAHVQEHRTTLVFVNTRRFAERFAHQLGERLGDDVVAAHHGSLSKDRRYRVESRLRAGDLKCLVATASLELGIDIGPVELVCQIGSPRSIATFLQRVGRSNHTRRGVPKGILYPLTRDELVECAGLLAAVRGGRLDAIHPAQMPLDIAAQQVIAEIAAQDWSTDDLFALVRRADPYRELSREQFDALVELAAHGVETGRGPRGRYIYHDAVNGEVRARKGARIAALTSGGAIPETGDYRVVAEPDDTFIGTVNEDWAVESMAGDIFLLGTHSWQIRRVEAGVVRVRDAGGAAPTVPFWLGEAPARTDELSGEVSELRAGVDALLAAGDPDAARMWITERCGVHEEAAAMIVDYLAVGRTVLGVMPTLDQIVVERFFDATGGMQLVIHAPYGGRVNRGFGIALRKKFCRTFNFELQAAATDNAIVLSLGPHHSFPLEEVTRYVRSDTVDDTLEHAILDSPMFISRWRWNLNRSLLVLRFRGGRRNPPPIQRMESDDLMAAMFPAAAACQDNQVGPIEIPDQLIVRQTIDDTLHEALDVNGLRALLEGIELGDVRVHCVDTTEPSVLAHEILTARPYAFLDDEEFQNRRVNAVNLRRGLAVDLTSIGRLEDDAIARVHEEIVADPAGPDELHDLLSSLVIVGPRDDWRPMFDELAARGRAGVLEHGGAPLWCATEARADAELAFAGDDAAVTAVVRGHLELAGVTTLDALAEATALPPGRVAFGLAALEQEGFAMRGRYTERAVEAEQEEWVARRLLARMHSYSRRARRDGIEPATVQDFMRFALRWQHLAPGTQLTGDEGLRRAIEQLQGWEAAAAAWESELLGRRMRGYDPGALDRLCHDGEVGWLRLAPKPRDADAPAGAPSKATPISVVFRDDLPWLLEAARAGADPAEPTLGATAEIAEVLRARGACFAAELGEATNRLPQDIERALWDGVARGLLTSDGFGAIRSRVGRSARGGMEAARLSRLMRGARAAGVGAGRWSLVPGTGGDTDREELAEAVAEMLLNRWGVVFRDLALRESIRFPWRDVQRALRRLEDRGLVRGGRFVSGFSGEQYALPAAVEQLIHTRKLPRNGERVTVNATDPVNLVGLVVPGESVAAIRTNRVVYVDGLPETAAPRELDDDAPMMSARAQGITQPRAVEIRYTVRGMTDDSDSQSRKAFRELLASLAEVDERYLSADFGVASEQDDADGHRFLVHLLETALHREFEGDPEHPEFTKWVTPRRKVLGDNPDAIYFDAPVDPRFVYKVRGNIGGAIYTSITIDAGTADGGYATRTAGVINDTDFDVAQDGSYEVTLGGPPQERNWMDLPDDAGHLTTRHYFELAEPAGADSTRVVPLTIERIGSDGPPPAPTDASVAAGIRRVNNFVRGNTVERPPRGAQKLPSFVSIVPNVFPKPVVPGDLGLAAFDAAYCSASYVLAPDEALVITMRWPECRFGNVTLWTRFLQTYDYAHRPCGRNRANTTLEPDGSFRIVLAHEDPRVPNWLDTEGRPSGSVFWRFFLPEGDIETPQAEVVKLADVRARA